MYHCCGLVISNTDKGFYATRSLWEREQNVPQTDCCPYPRLRTSSLALWERVGVRGKSLL
ncbi:hypothetical protein HAP32_04622 [Serratia fonticola]|jgi:hypothetical protein|nr:hypothetical protein HAP32_04622 [Serratia fonticola]